MFDLFSKGLASPVVLLGGTELKIKYANEAARKVLGLPSDLQDACLDRFLGDQNPSLLQSVQGVFESGLPANRHDEKLSLRRDGETVELFISYSCTPLSRAEGREALLVISIEQKKQETGGENSVLAFLNEDDCVFRRLCYFELNLETRLVRTVQKEIGKAPVNNTFSLAEFLNKVVPEHRSFVEEQFSRGIEQGILDLVCPVRQSDGSVHSIKVSGFSRSAELAGPPVFDGVFADVTAEKEVEEKQARLAAIVENTDDTILSKTLDGIITSWNPAAEKMFGYSEQEAVGKHISLIIPPERLHEEDDIISSIRSGKKVDHFETVRMTKDGQRIPISLTVSPIRDAEGRVVGASKIARNITLQKEAEEAAKRYTKSLEIINSMIRTVSDELNLKNILQKVSDATTQLTGAQFGAFFYHATRREDESFQLYTVSGVTPERFKNLGPVRHTPLFHTTFTGTGVERVDDITQDPRYGQNPPHHGMPEGHLPVVSYLAVPVVSKDGDVVGGLFFGHQEPGKFRPEHEDIVTAIAAQAAIALDNARLYEEVKWLNEKKDEFIGLASHELKTPLTSINGYLQILDKLLDDEMKKKFVGKTIQQVKKLSGLVADLLDISKIEAGKLQLSLSPFDLIDILHDAAELIEHSSSSHRVVLESQVDHLQVWGDAQRIEQVVINLLNNAIIYSPAADWVGIFVAVGEDEVTVSVEDRGPGIPEDKLQLIFTRFYRVEGLNPNISGLGIGLYLSQEIIARHNGRIWAERKEEGGAVFRFTLPLTGS